jgi:hypothetical protein
MCTFKRIVLPTYSYLTGQMKATLNTGNLGGGTFIGVKLRVDFITLLKSQATLSRLAHPPTLSYSPAMYLDDFQT